MTLKIGETLAEEICFRTAAIRGTSQRSARSAPQQKKATNERIRPKIKIRTNSRPSPPRSLNQRHYKKDTQAAYNDICDIPQGFAAHRRPCGIGPIDGRSDIRDATIGIYAYGRDGAVG